MKHRLSREDAQEVLHKLSVLADNPDGFEGYGLTQEQANELRDSVPHDGGEWNVADWAIAAVCGEMADHCEVLGDQSRSARQDGQIGQALTIARQAKRIRAMFAPDTV